MKAFIAAAGLWKQERRLAIDDYAHNPVKCAASIMACHL
jgi:hypothetical protein